MQFKKQTLIASACTLLLTGSAWAGASLNTLLGGGTLFSDNGKLLFTDFQFTPVLNAPAASNIEVLALDKGLLFGTPALSNSNSGAVDFGISYKVSGVDVELSSVKMESAGSASGNGTASIFKAVADQANEAVANVSNTFSSDTSISSSSSNFNPEAYLYVSDQVVLSPGDDGTAGINSFSQTFGTTSISAVPTPTAALGGMLLLGAVGLRRRRATK